MRDRLGRRLIGSVLLWDVLVTWVALYSTQGLRVLLDYGQEIYPWQAVIPWQIYVLVALTWSAIFLLVTPQRALFFSTLVEAVGRLVLAVGLAVLTFAGILYLSYRDVSRLQFLYFAMLDFVLLLTLHLSVRYAIRVRSKYTTAKRRTLIVGSGVQALQLQREFERRPWVGLTIVGCTTDEHTTDDRLPILGPVAATEQVVADHHIDEVIFVTDQKDQIVRLSLELQQAPVMLHMVPTVLDLAFARTPVETLGGVPLISLRESALTEGQRLLKRIFDIVGCTLLLIVLSPLMLLVGAAIKLESSGPIFFFQERIGEHGRKFRMIKFRSMFHQAERHWHKVAQRDADGRLVHKRDDDPRITRVGRWLRRTSLDEIPQLLNVLRGEMSLVGPRPEIPYIAMEYEPWQWQRFRMPPGMTGWWQVNGRSDKLMHLHTEDDLFYVQNYSFWLDLKILWRTVGVVLRGRGAY